MLHRYLFFCTVTYIAFIFAGCEDTLPLYTAPANTFSIDTSDVRSDTTIFSEPIDGSDASIATYAPYQITYKITNIYEETFQFVVNLKGTLEIWIPSARTTNSIVTVTNNSIVPTSDFNTTTNLLTLDPGKSIYIKVSIDPKLSQGYYIHRYVPVAYSTWVRYVVTKYFDKFTMNSRFNVQLADNAPPLSFESSFTLYLKGNFPFRP